ncbi:MAG: FAD/NAD(P)-binding oxidoreductase [Terracidiphilus sp.]|nr:FAD/NAD(P)-binding oxidoreductase [Terracidiphilus sp.]
MTASFDVVVVGAGPGGMAAATVAAEAGCRVCLLDDNAGPGGQIWRGFCTETARKFPHGSSFARWAQRLERSGCQAWQGWHAIDQPGAGLLRLERAGEHRDVGYGSLIVATGARERFLPFPGWTLPGVMGTGGLQALVKSGLNARGKRVVVAGSGPLLLAVGAGLASAGARVEGIYEQAPLARLAGFGLTLLGQPGKLLEGARYRLKTLRSAYRTGSWVVGAEGRGHVEHVTLTDGSSDWTVECDWLGCGFHLVPDLELPRLLGCRIAGGLVAVDGMQQSSVPGVACVGELTGIGGLDKALVEGQIAGFAAAGRRAEALALEPRRKRLQQFAERLERAFSLREELRKLATAETLICRCEDVAFAALEGCAGWRQARLYTRCGMGACQGRVCGAATEFLFGWENATARPPVFPAAVSTLAAGSAEETMHR